MFWRSSEIIGHGIRATDGPIGSIADLLFDDRIWTLRWLVVDTGTWLPGRKVLLSPLVLGTPDRLKREFPVDLTQREVEESPDIEADAPVSRQMETSLYEHYGWAPYWAGYAPPLDAAGLSPEHPPDAPARGEPLITGDIDLRSTNEVTGCYIKATDNDVGHVEDFLVEDGTWIIRYMIVDTRNWRPGKTVLISPAWIGDVSWGEQQVTVGLTRDQVKESPEYKPDLPVDRSYEERLYGHYDVGPYWI